GVVAARHRPQRRRVDGAQEAVLAQQFEDRRVLGVEDVGRRVALLLKDLVAERSLVGRSHLDVDPGLLFERLDEQRGRLFVLAAVERDRVRRAAPGGSAGREQEGGGGGQSEAQQLPQSRHGYPI